MCGNTTETIKHYILHFSYFKHQRQSFQQIAGIINSKLNLMIKGFL